MKKLFFVFLIFYTVSGFTQNLVSFERVGENSLTNLGITYSFPFFENGVEYYRMTYETPDVQGVLDTASGLVIVPDQFDKAYPLLCYQHGTLGSKDDVPSNLRGGFQLAEIWSGLGYVVCAPDLLGLGDSRGFHPYIHAASEASAAIDMMRATRELLPEIDREAHEQVFITGYSQGGHSAAALHREIQENLSNEFQVTASAPMSGPYSVSGVMNDFLFSLEPYFFVGYLPYVIISYETVYGNIYEDLEDLFRPEYADLIRPFAEGTKSLEVLNGELVSQLTQDFGASITLRMFRDSVLDAIAQNVDHPVNMALRDNDVFDWTPEAPTRLYYCTADDQVPFMNSVVADSVMNTNGAPDIEAIDVSPTSNHGECITPAIIQANFFFNQFQRIDFVLDTNDPTLAEAFSVFPNPVSETIFIENEKEEGTLQVSDLTGRNLLQSQLSKGKNNLNVSTLEQGVYLLRIQFEDSFFTQKVILE